LTIVFITLYARESRYLSSSRQNSEKKGERRTLTEGDIQRASSRTDETETVTAPHRTAPLVARTLASAVQRWNRVDELETWAEGARGTHWTQIRGLGLAAEQRAL